MTGPLLDHADVEGELFTAVRVDFGQVARDVLGRTGQLEQRIAAGRAVFSDDRVGEVVRAQLGQDRNRERYPGQSQGESSSYAPPVNEGRIVHQA